MSRIGNNRSEFRFGFDIGGTFTDIVVAARSGEVLTGKVLTTSDDIVLGVVHGLRELLERHGIPVAELDEIVAGATTVVTNLIIERKGATTGLITTIGFRDVIEIARELRYEIYDLHAGFPLPLVPQNLRKEVNERIDFQGKVVAPLDRGGVERAVAELVDSGIESIAVCLLHSYANPVHERFVKSVISDLAPNVHVSLSCDVLPEIREYERTVATVLNAYARPFIATYLKRIEEQLSSIGVDVTLRVMQSNGGVISRAYAELQPLRLLESGPAAGALAASHLARSASIDRVLAFDMGGTTAKACLITDGEPEVTTEFEAARVHRFKRGSGLPVRLPIVDLIEIGAGGGSIARIDTTGLMKVGPHSAGAHPGPACYGRGGASPTVTDAALILGYLDRESTLSGAVPLDYQRAWDAIETELARPLGITTVQAAAGVHRIVCEQMAAAAKIYAVEKGRDLRNYAMVAFGGAGPLHAREVARRLRCEHLLVPPDAGVFSAVGLLLAPDKVDAVRSLRMTLSDVRWDLVRSLFADMREEIAQALEGSGVPSEQIVYRYSADMRYVGQGFEVCATLPAAEEMSAKNAGAAFEQAYSAKFGRSLEDVDVEVISWRLEGTAPTAWLTETRLPRAIEEPGGARRRPVFFLECDGFVDTPVVSAGSIRPGRSYTGPMLIEQSGSTIVTGPGDTIESDALGVVHIRPAGVGA